VSLTLRYGVRTERGPVRANNQDSAFAAPWLVAIADGMGGMAAGDLASRHVIGAVAARASSRPPESLEGEALVEWLRTVAAEGNRLIAAEVAANPALAGMGTTLTGLLLVDGRIGMVHVGDSRAYRLRAGELQQVTKDDTYVQLLVDEGIIGRDEAFHHPQRSAVTRALQGEPVEPRYSVRPAVPGDRYLLCSDGLSDFLGEDEIAELLRTDATPQDCAERLVERALRDGSRDNVTVIVADVVVGSADAQPPVVVGAAADEPTVSTS
jgi:PPM family protein phosphatase